MSNDNAAPESAPGNEVHKFQPTTPDPKDIVLCIFHRNCLDGFTAAWVVRKVAMKYRIPFEFVDAAYGDAPPDVTGRHVVIVDFSYPRDVLEAMAKDARSIVVLDHHKTAATDLEGYPKPIPFAQWTRKGFAIEKSGAGRAEGESVIAALFDMNRSGAGLAWDFFFKIKDRPRIVAQVEDRDLWRFNIRDTREVNSVLGSYPYDFEVWDRLADALEDSDKRKTIVAAGQSIIRKTHRDIAELLGVATRKMRIGGHDVDVANLPYMWSSDGAGLLAEGKPFAASYFDRGDGKRVFSLRSRSGDGIDVSEIAKLYGGGGHRNAAGFMMEHGWEGDEQPAKGEDVVAEGR